jgi:hypothetical protein
MIQHADIEWALHVGSRVPRIWRRRLGVVHIPPVHLKCSIPWGDDSLSRIFEILKANDFRIVAGVDSDEVSAFVSRVESAGQSGEWKSMARQNVIV